MSNILKEAIQKAEQMPQEDQEKIGRTVLSYIESLARLRAEIDKALESLRAGSGEEFDIRGFILRRYGRA